MIDDDLDSSPSGPRALDWLEVGRLDGSGLGPLVLRGGERPHTSLHMKNGLTEGPVVEPDVLLLTDRRIVRLYANGGRRRAEFAAIEDIETVHVSVDRQGKAAFVWGILGIVAAALLWLVIDHPVGSVVAALAVALSGVYLIADRLIWRTTTQVTFNMRSARLSANLRGGRATSDVYAFIARFYQLKTRPPAPRHPSGLGGYPPC